MHSLAAELVWNGLKLAPASIGVAAAAAAAAMLLYVPQVRMLGRPWRWVLPGLRVLALAALAGSILKPVIRRTQFTGDLGAVVIVVDRSRSMSVRDLSGLPAQIATRGRLSVPAAGALVDLADDLGMLPSRVREESATGLQAGLRKLGDVVNELGRARRESDFARLSGRGADVAAARVTQLTSQVRDSARALSFRPAPGPKGQRLLPSVMALRTLSTSDPEPKLAHAVEAAARDVGAAQAEADRDLYQSNAEVRKACDALAKLSRFELVERALTDAGNGLLGRLGGDVPVFGFAAAGDLEPMALRGQGRPVRRLTAVPDGLKSDLTGTLAEALDRMKGQPVQAVVVFTDGRQVGGDATVASGLSASGVPIFAVLVAPDETRPETATEGGPLAPPPVRMTDVAVTQLSVPSSAFVGETMTVRAGVRGQGLGGAAVDVNLSVDGKPAATRKVNLVDGRAVAVTFPVKLDKAGVKTITVGVPPLPDEASPENNSLQRYVKVLSDKVKVAAVAGTAGWDYQYVRNALSRTPWVKLDDVILNSDAAPGAGGKLQWTPQQILEEDLVLLFDAPVSALSAQQWDAVYRLVTERGGSVVIAGGDADVLAGYEGHPLLSALEPFPAGVKPAWRVWPGKEPFFHLTPAPGAQSVDALRLDEAGGDPDVQARWAELPGFYRYMPAPGPLSSSPARNGLSPGELPPSGGFTPSGRFPQSRPSQAGMSPEGLPPGSFSQAGSDGVRPLLVERDSGAAVLTESRVGRGKAIFFGADETWRWRLKVGERDQDRFWLQLVRYAADAPYAAKGAGVALDADRVSAEPMTPVRVRAKVTDDAGDPASAPRQSIKILDDGKTVKSVSLTSVGPAGAGRYEGVVEGLPAGDYTLRLAGPSGGAPATLPLKVAPDPEAEMADLSGSEKPMSDLAAASGGAVLSLDQVSSLPERIARAQSNEGRLTDKPLWDSPWLFLFVLSCLAAEWAIRKRMGMV